MLWADWRRADWRRAEFWVAVGWFNKLFNRLKSIPCPISHSDLAIAIGAPQPEQVFVVAGRSGDW